MWGGGEGGGPFNGGAVSDVNSKKAQAQKIGKGYNSLTLEICGLALVGGGRGGNDTFVEGHMSPQAPTP